MKDMKPAAKRKASSGSSARRAPSKRAAVGKRAATKRAPLKQMSVKDVLAKRSRVKIMAAKTATVEIASAKPAERVRVRRPASLPVIHSEIAVTTHKFRVGESVHLTAGIYVRGRVTSVYKVTQLLPSDGDEQQYRIKSDTEPHERVAKQSQLEPVA